ncbi:PaaI family thioesterase [Acuticoccus sp.]|uniref:PaaI family thioesterase n=1 Tax=Acuticoccus sp. TaxID=1904378 RepID=UPI003B52E614
MPDRPVALSGPGVTVDPAGVQDRIGTAIGDHEQVFERFFLARLIGLEFAYLPEDAPDDAKEACRVRFPVQPFLFNPQGSLHGGILTTAMDISMGHLAKKVVGEGATATIELKVQFMRPISSGWATCEGRFLRRGRAIAFLESRLWDDDERPVAHATATWKMPG